MMPLLLLYSFKLHDIYSIFDVNPGALVEFARRMEAGYPSVNPSVICWLHIEASAIVFFLLAHTSQLDIRAEVLTPGGRSHS